MRRNSVYARLNPNSPLAGWRVRRNSDSAPGYVAAGRLNRTRVPTGASASQMRPPCASTIARETASPRPAPGLVRAASRPAPVERGEHVLALLGGGSRRRCRRPRTRSRRRPARARTTTLPSAGVWRIAFWIRLNRTRWSFSGLACAGRQRLRNVGAGPPRPSARPARASPRPSRRPAPAAAPARSTS